MRISVFGAGYVGLVSATCLASVGHTVICVDVDRDRVDELNAGRLPFFEEGLSSLMADCLAAGSLRFTTSHARAVKSSAVHIIAVGTPPRLDGSADVSQVLAVAEAIGQHLEKFSTVVVKSTVPVGTLDQVRSAVADGIASRDELVDFAVASNPEFLREGRAVHDFMEPDRVIVGASDRRAFDVLEKMYAPVVSSPAQVLRMSPRSAELAKYACNSMLAVRISFMNEMSSLADAYGADILEVKRAMGGDPRIGSQFLNAGIGFGGSCFPKDLRAAINLADQAGVDAAILKSAVVVNDRQQNFVVDELERQLADLRGRTIVLWGLAFKPDTDDCRDAPSLTIIRRLLSAGAHVVAHDPLVHWLPMFSSASTKRFQIVDNPIDALCGADALVLVTEWRQYADVDLEHVTATMKTPLVIDGRNLWSARRSEQSYIYVGIGRGVTQSAESKAVLVAG